MTPESTSNNEVCSGFANSWVFWPTLEFCNFDSNDSNESSSTLQSFKGKLAVAANDYDEIDEIFNTPEFQNQYDKDINRESALVNTPRLRDLRDAYYSVILTLENTDGELSESDKEKVINKLDFIKNY